MLQRFGKWASAKRAQGLEVSCVYCRSRWVDPATAPGASAGAAAGGYVNLSHVSEAHRTSQSLDELYGVHPHVPCQALLAGQDAILVSHSTEVLLVGSVDSVSCSIEVLLCAQAPLPSGLTIMLVAAMHGMLPGVLLAPCCVSVLHSLRLSVQWVDGCAFCCAACTINCEADDRGGCILLLVLDTCNAVVRSAAACNRCHCETRRRCDIAV